MGLFRFQTSIQFYNISFGGGGGGDSSDSKSPSNCITFHWGGGGGGVISVQVKTQKFPNLPNFLSFHFGVGGYLLWDFSDFKSSSNSSTFHFRWAGV